MLRTVGDIPDEQRKVLPSDSVMEIADLRIESYAISHDAVEPVGYCFEAGGVKLSLATDLGYVSDKVMRQLENSDVMVLESNHDVNMLRMGDILGISSVAYWAIRDISRTKRRAKRYAVATGDLKRGLGPSEPRS